MSKILELADAYAKAYMSFGEQKARAALIAEIERVKKDAARYRWLRDKSWAVYLKEGPDSHGWFPSDREDIDAAADAALKEATNEQDT